MIRTLFAQEFRVTRKWLLTSVGIALLVAAGAFALTLFIGPLPLVIGVLAIGIITPMVMGILVAHYWRTMYGSEGYFTMSLPVRGNALYAVKVTYGLVVVLASAIITVAATFGGVYLYSRSLGTTSEEIVSGLRDMINLVGAGMIWFIVACVVLQLAFTVIAGATIMSVGAEARFNHLGFGAPVIGAIIFYVIMQVVSFASMLFIPFGLKIDEAGPGAIVAQGMWSEFVKSVTVPSSGDPSVIGLGIIPVTIVLAIVLAWWGARSVDRRTSLR